MDKNRSSRSSTLNTEEYIQKVDALIRENQCIILVHVVAIPSISYESVQAIVNDDLGCSKICVCWVCPNKHIVQMWLCDQPKSFFLE